MKRQKGRSGPFHGLGESQKGNFQSRFGGLRGTVGFDEAELDAFLKSEAEPYQPPTCGSKSRPRPPAAAASRQGRPHERYLHPVPAVY